MRLGLARGALVLGAAWLLTACSGAAPSGSQSVAPGGTPAGKTSSRAAASPVQSAAPSTRPAPATGGSAAPATSGSAAASGAAAARSASGSPAASSAAAAFQSAGIQAVAAAAASLPANGPYACAQPASAGPPKGKVLIEVPAIEQSVGFKVSSVIPYSAVAGVLECEYNFDTPAGGAQLKLGIDQNTAKAKDDFAAVQSRKRALLDAGCNGCTLTDISPIAGLGDSAYKAKRNGDPTDVAVLKGAVSFEIFSLNLKEERLLAMAHAIADGPLS